LNAAFDWLAAQRPAMQAAVATLVDIDSNSHDKAGTDRVAQAMLGWLHDVDIEGEHRAHPDDGDALLVRLRGAVPTAAPVLAATSSPRARVAPPLPST
jgi:glutamate carboxypeptidase